MGKKSKGPPPSLTPPLTAELLASIAYLNEYVGEPGRATLSALHLVAEAQAKVADIVRELAAWAAKSAVNRHDLAIAGVIPALISVCTCGTLAQRELAAHALCQLAFNNPIVYGAAKAYTPEFTAFDNVAAMVKLDGIPIMVKGLTDGTRAQQEHAALAVSYMANTSDRRHAILHAGGLPPLLALVSRYVSSGDALGATAARHACQAVGCLTFQNEASQEAVRAVRGEVLLTDLAAGEHTPAPLRLVAQFALRNLTTTKPDPNAPSPPVATVAK